MGRILISAAHTLESPGAINGDLREADLTRSILKKVIPYLEKEKAEFQAVPLDLPLLQRIEWINNTGYSEANGDVFVEIHINDGGKRGIESWYKGSAGGTNESQKLAEKILEDVCKKTNYQNQGAKSEYDHELGSLLILNQINVIGTAIEFLYIDQPDDMAILKDDSKLDELAKHIAESLNNYAKNLKVSPKPAESSAPSPSPSPLFPMKSAGNPAPFPSAGMGGGMFGNTGAPPAMPSTPAAKPATLMDREERKEMIKKVYKRILGKEPNQSDLNYNLNVAVSEDDLTKKLLEGKEHEEMVKDASEAKDLRNKAAKAESELANIKGRINDLEAMSVNLNKLLAHKNQYIVQLQQTIEKANIVRSGERVHSGKNDFSQVESQKATYSSTPTLSGTIVRVLMKIFKL
jgi:hypothetical protein